MSMYLPECDIFIFYQIYSWTPLLRISSDQENLSVNHGKKKMRRAIKNDLCIPREAETEKIWYHQKDLWKFFLLSGHTIFQHYLFLSTIVWKTASQNWTKSVSDQIIICTIQLYWYAGLKLCYLHICDWSHLLENSMLFNLIINFLYFC